MSIVITAATGQLGRLVVDSLLARGVEPSGITAAARDAAKLESLAALEVRTVVADYDDPASLAEAFAADDVVLLVSSPTPGGRVAQHGNVITAATEAGVARIVYTSAPQAPTSTLILAPEHKATEELVIASGLPFTFLRNGWYTENYAQTLEQARETGVVLTSAGSGRVASASRVDFAEAAAAVLVGEGHEGAAYELSGDVAWDFPRLAAALTEVLGREVTVQDVTPAEHTAILVRAGLDEGTAGFVVALDGNIAEGTLEETSGELAKLIGRPTTPLVDGLRAIA